MADGKRGMGTTVRAGEGVRINAADDADADGNDYADDSECCGTGDGDDGNADNADHSD